MRIWRENVWSPECWDIDSWSTGGTKHCLESDKSLLEGGGTGRCNYMILWPDDDDDDDLTV